MPAPMTVEDKDKDLMPVRPPVMVTDPEEIASQSPNGEVQLRPEERELSPREQIYKNHDELHRPTSVPDPLEDGYVAEPVPTEPVAGDDPTLVRPEVPVELETPEVVARKKPGPKPQVEVTVNGVTRKVDKEKVDAHGGVEPYQMYVAGQEKLRLLSQREKNLQAGEAELKRQREELSTRPLATPVVEEPAVTPDLAPVEDQKSKLRRMANDALLEGDTEESARLNAEADELLVNIASQNAIQHMEQTELEKEQARETELANAKLRKRAADIEVGTAQFAIEFPEIMADTQLLQLANAQTVQVETAHPDWSPAEVMHEAGKNVTEWRKTQGNGAPAAPTSIQQKAQEKRSMTTPRAGSERSPRKPVPIEPTKGDYVRSLQQRRGQAVQ